MQQRQLRLGDILDDYCPRERRVTNHAVVAMIGEDVRQTRCTTCDAEHEYKHAKVPRPRKKEDSAVPQGQALGAPRRIVHDAPPEPVESLEPVEPVEPVDGDAPSMSQNASRVPVPPVLDALDVVDETTPAGLSAQADSPEAEGDPAPNEAAEDDATIEEGPVHRPLIRATLPRHEGQVPTARPAPEFTIRQPAGRPPNRFRGRNPRGGPMFQGNQSGNSMGGGQSRGPSSSRPQGGRAPHNSATSHPARRHDAGRKRSK